MILWYSLLKYSVKMSKPFLYLQIEVDELTSERDRRLNATVARDQEHGVRLVNGDSNSEGRLEVLYNGTWGSVCDDAFSNIDARVVCRQLGYTTGVALARAPFGQGVGTVWMDNVACNGTETRIQDCGHNGWGSHNCAHSEDVGIRCSHYPEAVQQDITALKVSSL